MISLMKPSAYLINTGRGSVVDEPALIEALISNKIAGADWTCSRRTAPADSPLRELDNVLLTSHYAWYSEGAIKELKRPLRWKFSGFCAAKNQNTSEIAMSDNMFD